MASFTTRDGTHIYYKDWGAGQPVLFSHGWPLNADAWDAQMVFLAERGYRVIAHDRRGHGRSSQPWNGNDMNTFADDLAGLIDKLDLNDVVMVGHSMGGGEVVRYIARHGVKRVAKAVLIASAPPFLLKTEANPAGLPMSIFDGMREGVRNNRSQFFKDVALPLYGFNRPDAQVSQGTIDAFWLAGMQGSIKASYDCIKAFSETDFTGDLKQVTVPALVVQGDDDQMVPLEISGMHSAKLMPNAQLKIYEGASHGLCTTHADRVNADLLAFIQS
ncbi:non-heme chloroperoxidase [Paraburkholderia sp. RAU2J]|uniref:alpha/beta fold hydrolase n=1 Tax=Paraburkholderia sp. RAU2J TaxID=1938810 RepID=UPI000EAD8164|nr:alpha/beta hydrolase [Paraburkholderia sp. RAU2J]RKT21595.1 non-heme chloroperoxidase [Paraburkholderia sp. RAU2J]